MIVAIDTEKKTISIKGYQDIPMITRILGLMSLSDEFTHYSLETERLIEYSIPTNKPMSNTDTINVSG